MTEPTLASPPKCNRAGCQVPAQYIVAIKLWAAGVSKAKTKPARMETGLFVCDVHRLDIHPVADWFADPASRDRIADAFVEKGKAAPDFNSAEYQFRRLKA